MKLRMWVIAILLAILLGITVSYASEISELQWKLRALIAESQLIQIQRESIDKQIQEFLKEADAKGFMVKDGVLIKKP